MIGPWEIGGILVIVILIFGTGKIAGVGKSLGTAIRDFKDSVRGETPENEKPIEETPKETGNSND